MDFDIIFQGHTFNVIKEKNKKRLILFVVISVVFVVLCSIMITLSCLDKITEVVGWIVNSSLSVAYVMYVLAFFKLPPQYTVISSFFCRLPTAERTYSRDVYIGEGDVYFLDGMECIELTFESNKYLLPKALDNPFVTGKVYQLAVVGRVVVEYSLEKELENDK